MAHKNYGGVEHGNTGYVNHTNNNSSQGYAQQHSQYHQSGNHNNTGYARGYVNGYDQNVYDYHQSGDHVNTGYSRGYNNGYNQDHGQYYNYYDYYEGCSGCCRDRKTRKDFLDENFNDGNSTRNGILRGYGQYSQSGNHTNYGYSRGYVNGYNQNYTDYHQSGNHTNTGYLRGYSNGYSQDYGQYNQSIGYNNHGNSGYTNHVNTTTNNAPGNVSNVSRGNGAYYKSTINLTWSAATDTPAYPIETFTPTFQNGFGNWGGAWGPVKVWRTRDKTVYIRGLVSCTQFGVIFNLPAGWRPTGGHLIFGSQEAASHCRINILNNGNVELSGSKSGGRSWINLNLCFNADASGWKDIPLMNTWVNYSDDNGWQRARYKVTDAGVTFVEGLIRSGPNGTIVGQLPNGVGPSGRLIRNSDSTNEACRLDFLDNGQIYIDLLGGSNGHTSITSCFLSKGRTDGWVNISLQNGWTNYNNGYSVARYNKLESGEVFVEGLINSGTTTDYVQVWDVAAISPKTTNIMVAGIKAGTNKNGSFGNSEHYPDGKFAKIWNASSNWHSVVHNYIIDQPTQVQTISYYIEYCFKPLGGSYGAWTRIVSGHTSTNYNYNLESHGNGHIKFRVLSSDGVENGSTWVESSEVRVLKYNAPSDWPTNNYVLSVDFTSVKNEITTLANSIASTVPTADVAAGSIVTGTAMTNLRDTTKEAASILGLAPIADTNLGFVTKADLDNIKAWLKGV